MWPLLSGDETEVTSVCVFREKDIFLCFCTRCVRLYFPAVGVLKNTKDVFTSQHFFFLFQSNAFKLHNLKINGFHLFVWIPSETGTIAVKLESSFMSL